MKWLLLVALLASAAACSAAGEKAEAGQPGPELKVELEDGLAAAVDGKGCLLLRRGDAVVARGALVVDGSAGRVAQGGMSGERLPDRSALAAWAVRGGSGSGGLRATVRAWKAGGALALSWDVSLRSPETAPRWGYLLTLPADAGAALKFKTGGGTGEQARWVQVSRDGKPWLRLLRDVPTKVEIVENGSDGSARLLLIGDASEPGGAGRGRFCLAFAGSDRPIPPLIYRAELWPPVRPGGAVRAELGVLAEFRSPFDPAQVRIDLDVEPPAGGRFRQPAFWSQEFAARTVKVPAVPAPDGGAAAGGEDAGAEAPAEVEKEVLDPQGQPGWRAVFDGRAEGLWRATVAVETPAGRARADAGTLRLGRATDEPMGPLAASARDRRYLVDPQGRAVFLLGHNLGWLVDERGPLGLDHWRAALDRMQKAGLNYARVWTCSWSLGIETPRPYEFDLGRAWRLDQVLTAAAERGIHVQLCLDNFDDFRNKRQLSPFFAGDKAICADTRDFFTSEPARRLYYAKLRYLAARYGHYPGLMAWELWNELDYCLDKNADPAGLEKARGEYLVPWALAAARELAALDRRQRLVTCSLADGTIWPELSGAGEIGLAESHVYLYMPDPERGRPADIARDALAVATREFSHYRKPALVSEFGFGAGGGPESPINDVDRLGIHLHNGIWTTALSGHAGAAALWWWDSYLAAPVDKDRARTEITGEDRYWHYRALGSFLRNVDWLAGWRTLTIAPPPAQGPNVLVVGLRTDREVLAWVADPENTWYNRAEKRYKPPQISGVSLGIDGLTAGEYQVTWWDTYAGRERTSSRQAVEFKGRLQLKVPTFSRDVAVRVRLVTPEPRGMSGGGGEHE